MPQASDELRQKFNFSGEDDGIATAEKIIKGAGGRIYPVGEIFCESNDPEVLDAIQFLCDEWDYCF